MSTQVSVRRSFLSRSYKLLKINIYNGSVYTVFTAAAQTCHYNNPFRFPSLFCKMCLSSTLYYICCVNILIRVFRNKNTFSFKLKVCFQASEGKILLWIIILLTFLAYFFVFIYQKVDRTTAVWKLHNNLYKETSAAMVLASRWKLTFEITSGKIEKQLRKIILHDFSALYMLSFFKV